MIDRWAWLDALVGRCVEEGRCEPSPALHDAIVWLGLGADHLRAAIASVLGVPSSRVADPDRRDLARIDGRRFALVAAPMLAHRSPAVRAIARRWLDDPVTLYQLPADVVERWLTAAGPCGDLLAERVATEGLALLGPAALARLARDSTRSAVREAAAAWVSRVSDDSAPPT